MGIRDIILNGPEKKREKRELGGKPVLIVEMGAGDRIEYFEFARSLNLQPLAEGEERTVEGVFDVSKKGAQLSAWVLKRTVFYENGELFFAADSVEDIARAVVGGGVDEIVETAFVMNALLKKQQDEKEGN